MLLKNIAVLSVVREADYRRVLPQPYAASIGGHTRHSIDHFSKLLFTDWSQPVRYDDRTRSRGGDVENDPAAARSALEAIVQRLGDFEQGGTDLHQPVTVAFMRGSDFSEFEMRSTVEREIAFLTHHAIHHLAMIKLIAASMQYELDEDLGLAPSTRAAKVAAPPPQSPPGPKGLTAVCNPGIQKEKPKVVDTVIVTDMGTAGKMVMCRCWRSKKFPHCDGSHAQHNQESGDNVGPLIIKI
eukprot:EG_transcript_18134